jgi:S-adenosylmethionine synthetase
MRPKALTSRLGLKNPIYSATAAYGHMGRHSYIKPVEFNTVKVTEIGGVKTEIRTRELREVEFFTWEKLDYVDKIKAAFGL